MTTNDARFAVAFGALGLLGLIGLFFGAAHGAESWPAVDAPCANARAWLAWGDAQSTDLGHAKIDEWCK